MGNLSPIEHNNFYTQSYFEQSAAVFSTYSGSITVTPFIGMGLVLDTKGYEWNNKIQPQAGSKGKQVLPQGRGKYRFGVCLRGSLQKLQQQRTDGVRAGLVRMAASRRKIEPFPRIHMD